MKITICSSIFHKKIVESIKKQLQTNHQVKTPNFSETNKEKSKSQYMTDHFKKIKWSDAILVVNKDKNGIKNYIGGNTLMEIGIALFLGKKIFLLNPIPDVIYTEEIRACKPIIIIDKNLDIINL